MDENVVVTKAQWGSAVCITVELRSHSDVPLVYE